MLLFKGDIWALTAALTCISSVSSWHVRRCRECNLSCSHSLVRSSMHAFIHSLIHSFIHSFMPFNQNIFPQGQVLKIPNSSLYDVLSWQSAHQQQCALMCFTISHVLCRLGCCSGSLGALAGCPNSTWGRQSIPMPSWLLLCFLLQFQLL